MVGFYFVSWHNRLIDRGKIILNELLKMFSKERPVGTKANDEMIDYLEHQFVDMGYAVRSLPFDCLVWDSGNSTLEINGQVYELSASPFSKPYTGTAQYVVVGSLDELKQTDCRGKIIILYGELTKTPLQPKDYPFYYPDKHKEIIITLEESGALAVIVATAKHPLYRLEPFYMFEDGNFAIPSAYFSAELLQNIQRGSDSDLGNVIINSQNKKVGSRQLIAQKSAKDCNGTIMVCAHMDSKYNTPGALDNAAGLLMMVRLMEYMKNYGLRFNVEYVPFNSEDYFGATGELAYLKDCKQNNTDFKLVINMDSPCHVGSKVAVSTYNFDKNMSSLLDGLLKEHMQVVQGADWYSGDHVIYAMNGLPSIAITSSDFFEGGLKDVHTPKDTADTVDCNLIDSGAVFLAALLKAI